MYETACDGEERESSVYVSRKNLGRAMYVDQAVNVVRPKSSGAGGRKVKPG
jgi:hypothetical protein